MKKARFHKEYTTLHLKPDVFLCPHCGNRLYFLYWMVDKLVVTLNGILNVRSEAWGCKNPQCLKEHGRILYRSNETYRHSLPKATFGLDVIAFIGFERSRNNRNFDEIYEDLQKQSVVISRRNVDYLYKSFEYLLRCSLPERIKTLRPKFEKNGGIILSIDGLQPQQGNDVLFVLRDVLTNETLHAEVLHTTDTEAMKRLFMVIRDSGVPVKGIISDGQHSIRKAKDEIFPEVPYQLCTAHYLKDLGKPVGEEDRALLSEFKKNPWIAPHRAQNRKRAK